MLHPRMVALGPFCILLILTPTAAAQQAGIDGSPAPPAPRVWVDREVLRPTGKFSEIGLHTQFEGPPGTCVSTDVYSNVYPFYLRCDAYSGWNAALFLRASVKHNGPGRKADPRIYVIVATARTPMGARSASCLCSVVVPIDGSLAALEEARAKAREAESAFHKVGKLPEGYFPVFYGTSNLSESLATVTITASDSAASEANLDPGEFTVSREGGDLSQPLTVYFTRSGTAIPEHDIQHMDEQVTILANSTTATIPVLVLDDGEVEDPETVTVTLQLPWDDSYAIGSPDQATVTVESNDVPATVTITGSNTPETIGNSGGFVITRDGDLTWPLTIWHSGFSGTATPNDYTVDFFGSSGSGYYDIPAGEASITIYILPVDDSEIEGPETVVLTLSPNSQYTLSASTATLTIIDDDKAVVTVEASDANAAESGMDTGEFIIRRTGLGSANFPLTVFFEVEGTAKPVSDYVPLAPASGLPSASGSITIPVGAASVVFTVAALDDDFAEGAETVVLTISEGVEYVVGSPPSATVTIADDTSDVVPLVTISATGLNALEKGTSPGAFLISRTGPTTNSVTVSYAVSGTATGGSDYEALSGSVTIPANSESASIPIVPVDDGDPESTETVILSITSGTGYGFDPPAEAQVTILDNDASISGTVRHAGTSDPISDAEVKAFRVSESGEELIASTTSAADGSYSLTGLEAESYLVRVTKPGFYENSKNVVLGSGETKTGVDFALDPWGLRLVPEKSAICAGGKSDAIHQTLLTATLTDPQTGESLGNRPITFGIQQGGSGGTLSNASEMTDGNGQATVELTSGELASESPTKSITTVTAQVSGFSTGTAQVEFQAPTYDLTAKPDALVPGEQAVLTLKLTWNGQPVENHSITWEVPGQIPVTDETDENGITTFTYPAGSPGTVEIAATDQDVRLASSLQHPRKAIGIQNGEARLPLGGKLVDTDKKLFKVYVPTKHGGKLTITPADKVKELKYPAAKDGTRKPYTNGAETGASTADQPVHGWYTFKIDDPANVTVESKFEQNAQAAGDRPWNFYWWSSKADYVREKANDPAKTAQSMKLAGSDDEVEIAQGKPTVAGEDIIRSGPNGTLESTAAEGDELRERINLFDKVGAFKPLVKYDQIYGTSVRDLDAQYNSTLISTVYKANLMKGIRDNLEWYGHCTGGAIASMLLKQPDPTEASGMSRDELEDLWALLVTRNIEKGLGIEPGARVTGVPSGPPKKEQDSTDEKVGEFHSVLEPQLKGASKSLLANLRPKAGGADEIWNHALWKYEATYKEGIAQPASERVVEITIKIYANQDAEPEPDTDGTADRVVTYVYVVKYNEDGTADKEAKENNWISVAGDAAWAPMSLLEVKKFVGLREHYRGFTEARLRAIDKANP